MSLFKKKNNKNDNVNEKEKINKNTNTDKTKNGIKILGSGCSKCIQLEKNTKEAMEELGLEEEIEHVTDFKEIALYGVMSTPALVQNGKVLSTGKVLTKNDIKKILESK